MASRHWLSLPIANYRIRGKSLKNVMNSVRLLALVLGCFAGAAAHAQTASITPVTWNVVGLDSNNVAVGPNVFPVGVRVCNTGTTLLAGYRTRFVWDTKNTYITKTSPEYLNVPNLAAGACQDMFNEVAITRDPAAYNQTARYHIDLLNAGGTIVQSTPVPREIYVERLISQNRNSVDAIRVNGTTVTLGSGSYAVNEGQTYTIEMLAHTATQGYEQLEQFLGLSSDLFTIKSVKSTYSAAAGTDFLATTKVYANGCGWVNDPTDVIDPSYRQCTGTGKYGGTTTVTYVVQVNSGAAALRPAGEKVQGVLYDFSGSSYHYNSDFSDGITFNFTTAPPASEVDLAMSKVGALASPGNGTFTLSVTNTSAIAATGVVVTDAVPNGYNIKNNQPVAPAGTSVAFVRTNPEGVTWTIGNLAAGQTISYAFDVQTVNGQTDYVNQACVTGTQTDPNAGNNCAKAQVPVAESDLAVTKTAGFTAPLKIGDPVTFTVSVVNLGSAVATGVVVTDTVPAGYSVTNATCASGWTLNSAAAPTYTCTASSTLPVGTVLVPVLTLTTTALAPVDPTLLTGYMNVASVTSTSNDPNPANNTASASQSPTFLTVAKTSDANSYTGPANTGTYTLTITKNGTYADLGTISVADVLPLDVTATSVSGTGWTCSALPSLSCIRSDDILAGPPTLPATYPPISIDVSFSGPSNPALVNRASVVAEKSGVVTSFDESSKTVAWTSASTYYTVDATSSLPAGGGANCTPDNVVSGGSSICTAAPATGYQFSGWAGACAAELSTTCSLSNVTSNLSSVANFQLLTYTVDATVSGAGGSATCSVSPISHGGTSACTATPSAGYRFAGWTGACAGATAACSLTGITENKVSVATFALIPSYTVSASTTGNGTATCTPTTVSDGGSSTCTATPASGYRFSSWSGACAGSTANCSLTAITENKTSVATFTPIPTYTVTASTTGNGTATCMPSPVTEGGSATCTATPSNDSTFGSWTGACAGQGATCTLSNVNTNLTSVAVFTLVPTFTVTVTTSGNGSATCTPSTVAAGGSVTCTAVPATGGAFNGWTGACVGQGAVCTLANVTANLATVAAFQILQTNVQQIPTLSEWGMIVMAALMLLAAFITLRRSA